MIMTIIDCICVVFMYVVGDDIYDGFSDDKSVESELDRIISQNQIVLFMKGSRRFPVCGLSSNICLMLRRCNLEFSTIDLLTRPSLALFMRVKHEPISAPYLYAGGSFIGGYETVCTMFNNGLLNNIAQIKTLK